MSRLLVNFYGLLKYDVFFPVFCLILLTSLQVCATVAETGQPKWWEKNAPNMVDIHSTQEFLSALSQAGDRLVIVEFYGTWCASCRALFPKVLFLLDFHPFILILFRRFFISCNICSQLYFVDNMFKIEQDVKLSVI